MMDEVEITRLILKGAVDEFLGHLEVDVAIAGAGPSGLVAAKYIADHDFNVAVFESKLSTGGGMWGGGMMFPKIVVEAAATAILGEFGINYQIEGDLYVADSIESVAKLTAKAIDAGAKIFNGITVEDVIIRDTGVSGFVLNWTAACMAGLHVDPLAIRSRFCIDATGHPAEVCRIVRRKVGGLKTPSGGIDGEGSMWAEKSELLVLENTKEVYANLYVAGMAANAVFGAPRMGPIFGGMLLSGKKAADLVLEKLILMDRK